MEINTQEHLGWRAELTHPQIPVRGRSRCSCWGGPRPDLLRSALEQQQDEDEDEAAWVFIHIILFGRSDHASYTKTRRETITELDTFMAVCVTPGLQTNYLDQHPRIIPKYNVKWVRVSILARSSIFIPMNRRLRRSVQGQSSYILVMTRTQNSWVCKMSLTFGWFVH